MAQFSYKARAANGEMISGMIEAADTSTAAKILMGRNVTPINIIASDESQESATGEQISFFTPKVKLEDLVIFARQMYSLTRAGIPILRAVTGLAETTNSKRMSIALFDVVNQLEKGRTISAALHQHPAIFSQLFVSVVHVGENTGKLDEAFLQLSEYLEREQETRKQIKAATRYPMFVLVAIVIALIVMNLVVIPIFASMFNKFGAELPLMTRILLTSSEFFINFWPHMLVGIVVGIFAGRRYLNTETGKYRWDRAKIRMPVVGTIFERTLLGRFARSFSMMLTAGVPLTTALTLVADAVANSFMADRILNMRRNIEKRGKPFPCCCLKWVIYSTGYADDQRWRRNRSGG